MQLFILDEIPERAAKMLYVILFIYSRGCAVFSDRLPRALIFSPFRAVYLQVLQQPLFL